MFQVYKVIQLYMYMLFYRVFSIIGYYKVLSIVPCATQYVFVVYFISINCKLPIYSSPSPFDNHKFVFFFFFFFFSFFFTNAEYFWASLKDVM